MNLKLAAAFLLAATVQTATGATNEYANVHTVAVVSMLGNQIDMQTTGITIFSNADYKLTFDLNLDAQIVQQAEAALQPQFAVKQVDDPAAFAGLEIGAWSFPRQLPSLPKAEGIDAYVVILPSDYVNSGFHLRGLTVNHHRDQLIRDPVTTISAQYAVIVFDAATGRRIDYAAATYPTKASLFGSLNPVEYCGNAMWADAADRMSDEQRGQLKKELSVLVGRSIAYTLASARLIDKSRADAVTAGFDTRGDPSCQEGLTDR